MFKKFAVKSENKNIEDYEPKEFSLSVTPEAESFERSELIGDGQFVINKSSADKSGLSYLKGKRVESEINKKVELQLAIEKENIFEEYKVKGHEEGIRQGVEEGKNSILEEFKKSIEKSLQQLNKVVDELQSFKKNLISNNENDMLELIQLATEKICLKEIRLDKDFTKKMIQKTLEENCREETLEIIISKEDHKHLSSFIAEIKKEKLPQSLSFISQEDMDVGGFILKSSKGKVDKTLKTRFEKVWTTLKQEDE